MKSPKFEDFGHREAAQVTHNFQKITVKWKLGIPWSLLIPNDLRFVTFYLLVAVTTVSAAIGNLASLSMELDAKQREFEFESRQLTPKMLEEMDVDGTQLSSVQMSFS